MWQSLRRWLIEKLGGYPTSGAALEQLCLVGATEDESELARSSIIKKLGGFPTVEAALEEIRSKNLKERHVILTLAVKKLFNTIDADDILKPGDGNQWLLEGKPLSKGQIESLKVEAAQLEGMLLWKVLKKDVLFQANRKLYLEVVNMEQVVNAKFWLYTFDTIRTRLKSIAAGSALYNSKS